MRSTNSSRWNYRLVNLADVRKRTRGNYYFSRKVCCKHSSPLTGEHIRRMQIRLLHFDRNTYVGALTSSWLKSLRIRDIGQFVPQKEREGERRGRGRKESEKVGNSLRAPADVRSEQILRLPGPS